jgi:hypothetical protein
MNPYTPPTSHIPDPELTGSSATAIIIGAAIGIGIAYLVLSPIDQAYFWILTFQGVPTDALYARAFQNTPYVVVTHVIGFVCCMPGGFWSARLSRRNPVRNAILAGIAITVFTAIQSIVPFPVPVPMWSQWATILIPLPAFFAGGFLWQRSASKLDI